MLSLKLTLSYTVSTRPAKAIKTLFIKNRKMVLGVVEHILIPALRKWRQYDQKFEASLGYMRLSLQKSKRKPSVNMGMQAYISDRSRNGIK